MTAASSDDGLLNVHEFGLFGSTDERACSVVITVREMAGASYVFWILRGWVMMAFIDVVVCEMTDCGRFLDGDCFSGLTDDVSSSVEVVVETNDGTMRGWPFSCDRIEVDVRRTSAVCGTICTIGDEVVIPSNCIGMGIPLFADLLCCNIIGWLPLLGDMPFASGRPSFGVCAS